MPSGRVGLASRRWGVPESLIGITISFVLMWLLVEWLTSGGYYDGRLALILSYAVVWVPLLGACTFACFVSGTRSLSKDLGLKFTYLDSLFGLSIGLLARAAASITEIAFYGQMNGLGVTFGEVVYDGWWIFGVIVAPIIVAPFVEEIFFRGLVLRTALRISCRMTKRTSVIISVVVSASLFAALHLAEVTNVTSALVVGISTLVFGLASGVLAALTGRIGGSIVAHSTYNGSLILAALLA